MHWYVCKTARIVFLKQHVLLLISLQREELNRM